MSRSQLSDPEQWMPRELFAAYCGVESSALLRYYDKARAKRKLMVMDFDWLAVLMLPAWLGYHRRWTMCVAFTACICGSFVFESLADVQIPSGAFAGAGLALGFMARGLLLSDANGLYLKLKRQGASPDEITEALAGQGKRHLGDRAAGRHRNCSDDCRDRAAPARRITELRCTGDLTAKRTRAQMVCDPSAFKRALVPPFSPRT